MAGAAELADGHLFDEDDVFRVTQSLPKNMSAVLVLLEHLWAKPLLDAVDRAAGVELSNDWIRPEEIVSVVHKAVAPRRAARLAAVLQRRPSALRGRWRTGARGASASACRRARTGGA